MHTVPLDLGILGIIQSGYRTMSRINQINGAKTEAWVLLDEMEAVAFKRRWPRLEANCRAQRIQSEIWSGDLSAARSEFARLSCLSDHKQLDPVALRLIEDETLISRARICCVTGLNAELIENLGRRVADLEAVGVHYLGARMRMLLALLHWHAGERVAATRALLPVLALAKAQGLCRIFIDEVRHMPEALVGICNELSRVDASLRSYLDSLLAEAGAAGLPPEGQEGTAGGGRTTEEGVCGLSDLDLLSSSEITEREKEILTQVANGLYNKEIARVLGISEGTVKWHLKNLYSKLSVSSRTQALKKAKLLGADRLSPVGAPPRSTNHAFFSEGVDGVPVEAELPKHLFRVGAELDSGEFVLMGVAGEAYRIRNLPLHFATRLPQLDHHSPSAQLWVCGRFRNAKNGFHAGFDVGKDPLPVGEALALESSGQHFAQFLVIGGILAQALTDQVRPSKHPAQ